jgi:hypothetical protein
VALVLAGERNWQLRLSRLSESDALSLSWLVCQSLVGRAVFVCWSWRLCESKRRVERAIGELAEETRLRLGIANNNNIND